MLRFLGGPLRRDFHVLFREKLFRALYLGGFGLYLVGLLCVLYRVMELLVL